MWTRDCLPLAGVALTAGPLIACAPLPGTLVALLVFVWHARSWRVAALAVAVAVAAAWRAEAALESFRTKLASTSGAIGAPSRCSGTARVVESPTSSRGAIRLVVEFHSLDCEKGPIAAPLRARVYGGPSRAVRGDELDIVAQLAPIRLFRNRGLMDPLPRAASAGVVLSGNTLAATTLRRGRGLLACIDRARIHARERLERTFAPLVVPMARALVLGENDLDEEDDEAFRRSGLSHLLAVSGTHLVFAVVTLLAALRSLLVRVEWLAARCDVARVAALPGIPLALLYADYAGGSGSAWRAAYMLAFACGVRALGRHCSGARALGVSLALGALVDPLASFDISFMLSAAATAGLLWIAAPWAQRLTRMKPRALGWLLGGLLATSSAMLPCAPLLALMSPTLTLAGLIANVFAAPLGEMAALPLCLGHALATPWPVLERGVALVASGSLAAVRWIAHRSASAEFSAISVPFPTPWHFAVIALAATLLAGLQCPWLRRLVGVSGILALVAIEQSVASAEAPRGVLRVTALDVEQGDSILVDLPDGRSMLIDGGGFVGSPVDPGHRVILPMLRARRRGRIDIAVLTHPHPDHMGGLLTALPDQSVGEFWVASRGQLGALGQLIQRLESRGTRIRTASDLCRGPTEFGAARVTVLAPCPAPRDGRGANDNSLVLRLEYGERAALLVGDAEREEERELLALPRSLLRAELLKAGHHGSRTSSGVEFLRAAAPTFAIISSGVRNRFGHPHSETLEAFSRLGITALRTDRLGSVAWVTNGVGTWFETYVGSR